MNSLEISVLKEYAKPIFHMRRQLHRSRFGLIFGAGVSMPWKIPSWNELNQKIAKDPDVGGEDLIDLDCSDTLLTQRLFEHYKARRYSEVSETERYTVRLDRRIRKEWRDIVHRQLYAKVPPGEDVEAFESEHGYISDYVKIMRHTALTVNYNFDDFLERILAHHRDEDEKYRTRGFEAAWDIRFPFRSDTRVVYHPNGYLPQNLMEASLQIVLSEDEFAEQLFGAMTGQNASLVHHLSRNTCLLIGLSLEDTTLKYLLRQVARGNPGQYHYYVHHCKADKKPTGSQKKAIAAANFDTYNLLTLFLCDEEIAALGRLLEDGCDSVEQKDLQIRGLAQAHNIRTNYCYYIVGAVGIGKSTQVMHFRNLIAYDEWFEPRSLSLARDPDTLDPGEVEALDRWIIDQFAKKNHKLAEESSGIFIIDRCPLDPVCFTPAEKWPEKAEKLLNTIAPGESQQVVDGRVILLLGDPGVLELRLIMTDKQYTEDRLARMQDDLKTIYDMPGVSVLDVSKMTLAEVTKQIARIIHMEDYQVPAKIHERMIKIKEGKVGCGT